MLANEMDDPQAVRSRAESEARINGQRQAMLDEAAAHRAAIQREIDDTKAELELMMGELTKGEQRQVRMHAYLHALNGDSHGGMIQTEADRTCLRLARYMTTGEAK